VVDEDGDPPELWWYAEWGLDGSSSGSEHSTPDLAELVGLVKGTAHPGQPIRWVICDDDGALAEIGVSPVSEAVARTGVVLPQTG
jgi:hypothetical protein